jgi:5-methylcytosine-specific restriction endonuclease McrA
VPGAGTAVELRQITLPRAAIIGAVSAFRLAAAAAGGDLMAPGSPSAARALSGDAGSGRGHRRRAAAAPVAGGRVRRHRLPVPLRARLGAAGVLLPARLRRHGPQGPAVRLLPGAGDELLRLGPLVRPLVELHWTRMVAEINKVATAELDLRRHLFGSDRVLPPRALRDGVAALQDGQCFYCGGTLGATPEADHFIPRIRCGIDAIENLVLADRRCNNDKRDLLPGPPHVTAWARRNQRHGTALTSLATASRWDSDPAATMAVARSIYSHLPPGGTPLWLGFKDVSNADPAAALAALA